MRRLPATLAALALLGACASQTYPVEPPPEVQLFQLYGPSDLNYSRGMNSIQAQYGIQIKNPSPDPIILRHVTLESVGSTTMLLRREERAFNNEIPPGQTGQAVVNARIYYTVDMSGSPSREPLTLRATLRFESPKGSFNKIVQSNIGQFPGQ